MENFFSPRLETASFLTAVALSHLLKAPPLLERGVGLAGFYLIYALESGINPELKGVLEERIKGMIRDDLPIEVKEMVSFSAAEWLRHQGQKGRAKELKEGMVFLAKGGDFIDIKQGEMFFSASPVGHIALTRMEVVDGCLVIEGSAAETKEELKERVKRGKKNLSFQERCEKLRWTRHGVWLSLGLKEREKILTLWTSRLEAAFVFGESRKEVALVGEEVKGRLALFGAYPGEKLEVWQFFKGGDLISLLHSIGETFNILGFDFRLVSPLSGGTPPEMKGFPSEYGEVDAFAAFQVENVLGQRRSIASLYREREGWRVSLGIEETLAALLEKEVIIENQ